MPLAPLLRSVNRIDAPKLSVHRLRLLLPDSDGDGSRLSLLELAGRAVVVGQLPALRKRRGQQFF